MPNGDHLYQGPTGKECRLSRVFCMLDELDGKSWTEDEWYGKHPKVYGHANELNEQALTGQLVYEINELGTAITDYSLELQMWWRDYKERVRKVDELARVAVRREQKRKAALAKLTPDERKLLGL